MAEAFCVIVKRTLPSQHPLNEILKYHCREILVPNTFGVPNLLGESKLADLLFAHGNDGAYQLLRESYPLSTWEITDYRANIEVRGQHVAFNRKFGYKRGLAWESCSHLESTINHQSVKTTCVFFLRPLPMKWS